ncbi:hypothetical protein DH2020_045644 [Rehmannia glutinosa]|uniref:Uncharacterized protein n=1 Tax=Rehmannia glutinosa TaxID=99300 RepID=A0ABR0UF98_REHGL
MPIRSSIYKILDGEGDKIETLSIDGENSTMSLCKSRDCEGGLEIGLSLPRGKMDAFAAVFADGMKVAAWGFFLKLVQIIRLRNEAEKGKGDLFQENGGFGRGDCLGTFSSSIKENGNQGCFNKEGWWEEEGDQGKLSRYRLVKATRYQIAPPPGTVADRSLPLTFFDIIWLHFHPIRRLLFYKFPCSKPYFLESLIPKLKESLSLTLKHYFPLAGHLLYPLDAQKKPIIRYVAGDSVPLTIFESTNDFDNLDGDHPRDADAFYDYIPQLPPIITDIESNHKLLKVLALQVTLFPGQGICIGLANHHAVGDANSIVGFIRFWASINKLGGNEEYSNLPFFDRSLIKDPIGIDSIYWNQMKEIPLKLPSFPLPTKRVRSTYVLNESEIKKLKDLVLAKFPGFVHASSFVVTAAYVWSCLTKSQTPGGQETIKYNDDEMEFFLFAVDCRARLDPPLPGNYFGNCVSYGLGKIRHQELTGTDGFFMAAQAIAEEIKTGRMIRRNYWKALRIGADFGWGKVRKMETLSIDGEDYAMSLCKSRDYEGGLEIGLTLPKLKMDAFAVVFAHGMELCHNT